LDSTASRTESILLGHVGHAKIAPSFDLSGVGLLDAGEHLEQRALAATVGADQADPVAFLEMQSNPLEQGSRGQGSSKRPTFSPGASAAYTCRPGADRHPPGTGGWHRGSRPDRRDGHGIGGGGH
jgi:hypothetical protein